MKRIIYSIIGMVLVLSTSCEDLEKYELPESNSIADETPPSASFSAIQGEGFENEEWRDYQFTNGSVSATQYLWDFGDGNTSTEFEPVNRFPGEGTYVVSLTASDALGISDTFIQDIEVIEPEAPAVPDPVLVNAEFVKLPKSSGSDCACAGWINRDLGDQGESSTASGEDVVKFDNNEPDHIYQEFEVVPNSEYLIETSIRHSSTDGTMPSSLEIRVLAGSAYESGYTPVYYTDTAAMPQGNSSTGYWGYRSVEQVEDANNNLAIQVLDNPGNDDYNTYFISFNSGANNSVALFMRGVGGDSSGNYGYNSGNEEIRSAFVNITANE